VQVALEFESRTGLVMHNVRLADKYDPYSQQIAALTDKKKHRTEADDAEITRLEWYGGLYHAADVGVYVPAANIVRCLQNAGTITRDGTTVVRGISMLTDRVPLKYPGPKDLAELFTKPEYGLRVAVGVQRNKVMRMRPIFRTWALSFEIEMAEDVIDLDAFVAIAERAGRSEGLGDARKLGYGRFNVTVASDPTRAEVLRQHHRNGGVPGGAVTAR